SVALILGTTVFVPEVAEVQDDRRAGPNPHDVATLRRQWEGSTTFDSRLEPRPRVVSYEPTRTDVPPIAVLANHGHAAIANSEDLIDIEVHRLCVDAFGLGNYVSKFTASVGVSMP